MTKLQYYLIRQNIAVDKRQIIQYNCGSEFCYEKVTQKGNYMLRDGIKLSKLLAGFAWFNVFALMWAALFEPLSSKGGLIVWTLLLFLLIALVCSVIQGKNVSFGD